MTTDPRLRPGIVRETLGLSRAEWARALNVNVATVRRWEDAGADPGGLAVAVLRGITAALDDGADPTRVARVVSMGISSVLCYGIHHKVTR